MSLNVGLEDCLVVERRRCQKYTTAQLSCGFSLNADRSAVHYR